MAAIQALRGPAWSREPPGRSLRRRLFSSSTSWASRCAACKPPALPLTVADARVCCQIYWSLAAKYSFLPVPALVQAHLGARRQSPARPRPPLTRPPASPTAPVLSSPRVSALDAPGASSLDAPDASAGQVASPVPSAPGPFKQEDYVLSPALVRVSLHQARRHTARGLTQLSAPPKRRSVTPCRTSSW